ncbi:MAG TPA: 50S ribosomal protein L24 [Candidatus Woesebacteria bacterium]|nr:50S ribosomal protein L24 [Candidatus Woesebacteria bacterium]
MKLRIGDQVIVVTGKDKGKKGAVKKIDPKKNLVLVEGVNQIVKHRKPMMGRAGERVIKEKALNASKLMILNRAGEPDRVGYTILKNGDKMRIFRKTGEMIDAAKAKPTKK